MKYLLPLIFLVIPVAAQAEYFPPASGNAPFATPFGSVATDAAHRFGSLQCNVVADEGADPTGATDDLAAINACIATGKPVYFPSQANGQPAVYLVSAAPTFLTGTVLFGDGPYLSTIRLRNGANTDVLVGQNAYSLFGTNSNGGANSWSIFGLTIDGNAANQSCANADDCNGIAVYGGNWRLYNDVIENTFGNGLRTEWGNGAIITATPPAYVDNVTIHTTNRNGWECAGPHDIDAHRLVIYDASQSADNTYASLNETSAKCNGRFFDFHGWNSGTTNKAAFNVISQGASQFIGSHFEGVRQQFEHLGNSDIITGSWFYAPAGASGTAMEVFAHGSAQNQSVGNQYSGTPGSGIEAVQIGDGTGSASGNSLIGEYFLNFDTNPAINLVSDGGNNVIRANGFAPAGGSTACALGTQASTTTLVYQQTGTVVNCAIISGGLGTQNTQGTSSNAVGNHVSATGFGSVALGFQSYDRGLPGRAVFASGDISTLGDSQWALSTLRGSGSGAAAIRVTENGSAANSSNCLNLPSDNTKYSFRIALKATDETNPANDYSWWDDHVTLARYTGVASTVLATAGSQITLSHGTVTGASVSKEAADTTNGCLDLEWTPPTSNTDTWHVVAVISGPEAK